MTRNYIEYEILHRAKGNTFEDVLVKVYQDEQQTIYDAIYDLLLHRKLPYMSRDLGINFLKADVQDDQTA